MRPVFATIHLGHLAHNFQALQRQAGDAAVMAVVKADAYGHGLEKVADTLYEHGCRLFAVSDAAEGVSLRQTLANDADIVLLSGIFDVDDAKACKAYALTPVVSQETHIRYLAQADFRGQAWLKTDTGMNRIGTDDIAHLLNTLQQHHIRCAGIMSHLACADTPDHPLNQQQLQRFRQLQTQHDAPAYSLMNTAGMIAFMDSIDTQVVRPGIGLYGIEPVANHPLGFKPVMQLGGQIVQVRQVKAGDTVSYGATWQASRDTWIGIVSLGYADGLPRILSNQGHLHHPSGKLPIVGRVCMDYCMVELDPLKAHQGDAVHLFGFEANVPHADKVAEQCNTIAYELFTQIPARIPRRYIKE